MFTALLILLAASDATLGLKCIYECSLREVPFGEDLRIRGRQCQKRLERDSCKIEVVLDYHQQTYTVNFPFDSDEVESITITPPSRLDYEFDLECSTDDDCILEDAQTRISELTRRPYNTQIIYEEISIITGAAPEVPMKCVNTRDEIVTCVSGDRCEIQYDLKAQMVSQRACGSPFGPAVLVYENSMFSSFDIVCSHSLCNTVETYEKIKGILNKNNMVDANGRINATGAPDGC